MDSIPDIINMIKKDLKIKPLDFGFAGELYSTWNGWSTEQFKLIGKYIFEYQNTCVNRTALYYSTSFSDTIAMAEQGYDDYCCIYQLLLDDHLKRYVLFSIVEYLINAISKLLNLCFENKNFRFDFYTALKIHLELYMDTLVELMFSEILPEMPSIRDDLYGNIRNFYKVVNAPELREYTEYDHKLQLVYAYVLYYDLIGSNQLLLSPLLGAAQIPPFIKSIEKYFGDRFCQSRTITYDYVKYSTYDITDFYALEEQAAELIQAYSQCSIVLLLDDNLGTGTTLLEIKKVLANYFSEIKIGAVEFYWTKKIVWNTDNEWFDINRIDYITPIAYRHWMLLNNQVACFKFGVFNYLPYVPYMIYDDHNFQYYMSKQNITDEKKKSMDMLSYKSRLIKETFYTTSPCADESPRQQCSSILSGGVIKLSDWKTILKADPTDWLLENENPSVRYFTLKHILGKPENDTEVQHARRDIMQFGIVPEILQKQQESAYLQTYPRFYTNKYKGLVWSLITLAELGADASPQIKEQCEYILNYSQETQDGGFSQNTAVKTGGGRIGEVIPCLTGNMVWSLIRFGYIDDPRLQKGIDWLIQYMCLNDGTELTHQAPPYNHYEMCWGNHTCHMGVVKALKALGAIPEERRTQAVKDTIAEASEFMLIHHIFKRSHDLKRKSKPGWLKFGFPLMYQTDVLEILDIFSGLGIRDTRMNEALNLVVSKQDDMGRWKIESTYNSDRLLTPMGQKNEQSKWLTLRAMNVLKAQYT